MANKDLERKIEFIVEQQAQFAVDIQQLRERQDRFQEQMETVGKQIERIEGQIHSLTVLSNSNMETQREIMEVVKKLAEAQSQTHKQLNKLSRLFARHVSNGHGGA